MHEYAAGIVARDLNRERLRQAEQSRMARMATRGVGRKSRVARSGDTESEHPGLAGLIRRLLQHAHAS